MPDNNDKLKKMMEEASSAKNDSKAQQEISKKVSPKKKKWPWIVGVCAVALIGVGVYFAVPKLSNTQKLDKTSLATKVDKDTASGDADVSSIGSPISLKPWQEKSISDQQTTKKAQKELNSNLEAWVQTDAQAQGILNSGFASASGDVTDDTTEALLKDGTPNPKYSFLTSDNVKQNYSSYVNRLINPVFGTWGDLQYSKNNPKSNAAATLLRDMFTDDWWYANTKAGEDYSKVPVFADWNANDYGMKFKDEKGSQGRWFGEVVSENIRTNQNSDGSFKNIELTANIKYSAYSSDGSIATKMGVLKLTMVQNPSTDNNPTNRILINNATLTIK